MGGEGAPRHDDQKELLLATTVQALFHARGLTLTDHATAQSFRVSLQATRWVIGGALANGLITNDAFDEMTDHLDAMERSPDLL